MASLPVEPASPRLYCSECGGAFPAQDLAKFGNSYVCANCKPGYVQRMREGAQPVGMSMAATRFAGFWIRTAALFIDSLILSVVIVPIFLAVGFGSGLFRSFDPEHGPGAGVAVVFLLMEVVIFVLVLVYQVYFITKKGGTPGKLALGLKIVNAADGSYLSVGKAVGRYFAYMLSGMILYIGYIIAAFDSEKRALHDHICSTRVIYQK